MSEPNKNYFEELFSVDVNDKTEKKNGLTYLSWAWAWSEVKKRYPKSFYTIYETHDNMNYFTDGKTCWVKTGVTVVTDDGSLEHIEYLPVMDNRNKSIPLESITSFDVNKAVQRSLTKAVARHGLGLYVYAGEDLPEESKIKATNLEKMIANIIDVCKAKTKETSREAVTNAIASVNGGNPNPNSIDSEETAGKVLETLNALKGGK